jgi:uncharacterized protein (DUF885 family)
LARLRAIPPGPAQAVNRAAFERMLSEQIEEYELGWRFVPVNMRDGIQNTADLANLLHFRDERDYRDWLARLRAFPVYMDQTMALMREGMRRRLVQPKIVMQRVPAQIERQLQSNPFLAPFSSQPPVLRNEAKLVIETAVFPACAVSLVSSKPSTFPRATTEPASGRRRREPGSMPISRAASRPRA